MSRSEFEECVFLYKCYFTYSLMVLYYVTAQKWTALPANVNDNNKRVPQCLCCRLIRRLPATSLATTVLSWSSACIAHTRNWAIWAALQTGEGQLLRRNHCDSPLMIYHWEGLTVLGHLFLSLCTYFMCIERLHVSVNVPIIFLWWLTIHWASEKQVTELKN